MEDSVTNPGTVVIFFVLLFLEMIVYGFNSATQNRHEQEQEDGRKEPNKRAARLQYLIDNPAKYANAIQLGVVTVNMLFGALYLYLSLIHISEPTRPY